MTNQVNRGLSGLANSERIFVIGTTVWIFLQLSRSIAIVLINDINAGAASEAWRYPAYLDLVAVIFALPLIWAVWARRGLLSWVATIIYWVVSIVDHVGNFVTTTFVGAPSIAEGMNPFLVPAIQTALDVVFLALLLVPKFRKLFFNVSNTLSQSATG